MKNLQSLILHEDSAIIAVNKPSGLVVNRSTTWKGDTLQDLLEEKFPNLYKDESEFSSRNGIVHRLDKETSGVLLIAKDEQTFKYLQLLFKKREISKKYVALVYGKFPDDKVELNAPIKRNPSNRFKYAVVKDGKNAQTIFTKMYDKEWQGIKLSLIVAMPKTGRTHQIRVHLAALNHPVVGDPLYLGKKRMQSSRDYFHRMMLHANSLTFRHPTTEKELTIEAPIPEEFHLS